MYSEWSGISTLCWFGMIFLTKLGTLSPSRALNQNKREAGKACRGPIRGQPGRVGSTFADPVDCLPCGLKTNLP